MQIETGGSFVDDRGVMQFANEFDIASKGIRRWYMVQMHTAGVVRAWHAHRSEEKFIIPLDGAMLVCAVPITNWECPETDVHVQRFVLSPLAPCVCHIESGWAHGLMSLSAAARVLVLSTLTIEDSRKDDIRFPPRYWDVWRVMER